MFKRICRSNALKLLLLMMISVFIIGCGSKKYASLEEYVKSNPSVQAELDKTLSSSDGTGKSEISGNTIIMKMYYKEQAWGLDASIDSQLKSLMDQYFDKASATLDQSISQIAQESGVDASLISFRYEYYNPNAESPSYTYTYPKK
ncbi:MAG: hypothetical protein IJ716_13870 [Lachnospiraceae bacterium]|nr:hypothetical protein [Lachnospiraceae bacterium]